MSGQSRFLVFASGICAAAGIALGCAGWQSTETPPPPDPAVYHAFTRSLLTVKVPVVEVSRKEGRFADFAERYPWLPQREPPDERRFGTAELIVRERPDTSALAFESTDAGSREEPHTSAPLEGAECRAEASDRETIEASARADAEFAALLREAERPGSLRFNEVKPPEENQGTAAKNEGPDALEARKLAKLAQRLQEARLKLVSGQSKATGGSLPRETFDQMLAELDESLRAVAADFVETSGATWVIVCDLQPTSSDLAKGQKSWPLFSDAEVRSRLRPIERPELVDLDDASGGGGSNFVLSIEDIETPPVSAAKRRCWLLGRWLCTGGPDPAPIPTRATAKLSFDDGKQKRVVREEEIRLLESGPIAFRAAPTARLREP